MTDVTVQETAEALAGRLFEAALGAIDIFSIYLGDRLGYYRALAELGPATALELAKHIGKHPRYAREWLEQQAVTGILEVDDPAASEDARRYSVPASRAEVLTDPESLNAMAWLPRLLVAMGRALPDTIEAHRGSPRAASARCMRSWRITGSAFR